MTAKEIFERVLKYGVQFDDMDIKVRIRNDETGDYLDITDVWVNASGDVMIEVRKI